VLSGLNATEETGPVCPFLCIVTLFFFTSRSVMVLSNNPEAKTVSSGLNATEEIEVSDPIVFTSSYSSGSTIPLISVATSGGKPRPLVLFGLTSPAKKAPRSASSFSARGRLRLMPRRFMSSSISSAVISAIGFSGGAAVRRPTTHKTAAIMTAMVIFLNTVISLSFLIHLQLLVYASGLFSPFRRVLHLL